MSEKRLHFIDLQLSKLEQHKKELLSERETLLNNQRASTVAVEQSGLFTTNQKIELFMQLFKGRTDLFANRWKNTKGQSGYAVACHNE